MSLILLNNINREVCKSLWQMTFKMNTRNQRLKCNDTMEAVVFDGEKLCVKHCCDYPKPQLTTGDDVIVKIEYAGICGTDLHIIKGDFPARKSPPFPLGHESAGVIESVGKNSVFKPGQKVSIYPCSPCNLCDFCRVGTYQHCSIGGINSYIGIFKDGGWAQYLRVPQELVYVLPEGVTTQQAGLTEPYSCVVHTFNRAAPLKVGQKILILGAGIIGNLFATALHHHGHRDVTISEPIKNRLKIASKLNTGFRLVVPETLEKEKELYDVIFDCTGVGQAMEVSFNYLKQGGKYVVFGCCPKTHQAKVSPFEIFDKELTLIGAKTNPYTFVTALKWMEAMGDRYVNYDKLGVKTYRLCEYQKALTDLKSGSVAKGVFKID